MRGIRELIRESLPGGGISVVAGDSIELTYFGPDGRKVCATKTFDKTYHFTEAAIFEAEAGVFGPGRAVGGVFVESSQ